MKPIQVPASPVRPVNVQYSGWQPYRSFLFSQPSGIMALSAQFMVITM